MQAIATPEAWPRPQHESDEELTRRIRAVAVCLAAVILAFHYSLLTLIRDLGVDTPLAYLGLVPLISLALIWRRARRQAWEPPIHDRQIDYIVGLPLLCLSLGINYLLPIHLSTIFWLWRVDLLSLPIFCAGAVVLLFGVRSLWRYRLPLAFLFLAWPLPYTTVLLSELNAFSLTTLAGIRACLHALPVATPISGGDGSLFQIHHGASGFPVGVASACSGVNSVVGFALIGGAFITELVGAWWKRAAWLFVGLAATWVLNVLRIMAIFTAGDWWGSKVALDGLHPVLGLVMFSGGVFAMLSLLGRFRLDIKPSRPPAAADPRFAGTTTPPHPPAVAHTRVAVSLVLVVGLISGVANAGLRTFDLVANLDGSPKLVAYQVFQGHPVGWRARKVAQFDWATEFFGDNSSWIRYDLAWDGITPTPLHTRDHVTVDVVSTTDVSTFQRYGVEACYRFHGYQLESQRTVDLGGVSANLLSYRNPTLNSTWTTVYWYWPVRSRQGTRYERVVMILSDSANTRLTAGVPGKSGGGSLPDLIDDRISGKQTRATDKGMARTQDFLLALAAATIKHQPSAAILDS